MTSFTSRSRFKMACTCVCLALLGAQALSAQEASQTKTWKSLDSGLSLRVSETLIGENTEEILEDSFLQGPDGQSVVYVVMSAGKMHVHRNNTPGAPFDGISLDTLHYSPDGQRLAYLGVREEKNIVVLDEKEYVYEAVTEEGVQFSPDSKHASWVVKTPEGKQALVFDGVLQAPHDGVSPAGVEYSSDGQHYAYQVSDANRTSIVLDGVPGPHVQGILEYRFSPGGGRLGVIAEEGDEKLVFLDGKLVAQVDGIGKGGIRFSSNGEHYFLAVRRGEVWSMLIDGEYEGQYAALIPNYKVRHDGQQYAYMASPGKGAGLSLYVNGEQKLEDKGIQALSFNPVSDDLAYVIRKDSKSYAIIDGVQGAAYDSIERTGIIFSRDGKHYAYSARNGDKRYVVLDGVPSAPLDRYGPVQPTFLENGTLVYTSIVGDFMRFVFDRELQPTFSKVNALFVSPDGNHTAYIANEGTRRIAVIDGKRDGEYARIPRAPIFSPDGKKYAYVGHTGNKHEVVINGDVVGTYDYVMHRSLTFTPDGEHLVYLAARGAERMLMLDDIEVTNNYTGFLQLRNITFDAEDHFFVRASRGNDMLRLSCDILKE